MKGSNKLSHKQMETTPQQWERWANYESNKDRFIKEQEEQEEQDDIQENTDSLEEKIEALNDLEIKRTKEETTIELNNNWLEHQTKWRNRFLDEVLDIIKDRTPNEYGVRQYKTVEARTYDEKNLVIEALDDLKEKLLTLKN